MIKKILIALLGIVFLSPAFAQEVETDLLYNPFQNEIYQKEKSFTPKENRGGSLELPFFDDFSKYSLATNDPEIPGEWARWTDAHAYLNDHLPIEPPTIGVATLDGLKANGYPYNFNSTGATHIPADTLTSRQINMDGYNQTDNIHLMFFYQAQGWGNDPDPQDSLILEFKVGEDVWVPKWSIGGTTLNDFQQVFIEVWDADFGNFYFQDGFQFRFRNISEGTGNLDHWHLDYILMDEDIDPETYIIQDLAIMYPINSLLYNSLTAMPWTHYLNNPSAYTFSDSITLWERNLNPLDFNFRSGFNVSYSDFDTDYFLDLPNPYVNPNNNASSIIDTPVPINVGPNDFVFPASVNDSCAEFTVKFYHEIVDGVISNDTTTFIQRFTNYYAHDDGSAERGWFINASGAKVGVKYQSVVPDTLLGLLIHFTPMRENNEDEIFILRAWNDDGGIPGTEIEETNFVQHTPEYYEGGYNLFKYYEYDDPLPVDGNFYCGFAQSTDAKMNVGNDKNTNSNTFSLFYTEGPFSPWQQSGIEGSIMIRPVLKSGKGYENVAIDETPELEWNIYPNPSKDIINIETEINDFQLDIYEISGRLVYSEIHYSTFSQVDISNFERGSYLVLLSSADGQTISQKIIVKE